MVKTSKGTLYIVLAAAILALIYFFYFGTKPVVRENSNVALASYTNAEGQKWQIPTGNYQFNVASAEKYPRMVIGFINPLDVKVGDTQKMSISINGDAPMKRVWAEIETDNSTTTVELSLVATSTISAADIMKQPYLVDANGWLVVNDGKNPLVQNIVKIAEASAPIMQYRYEGEWTVADTHTRTYHTKFNVVDTANRSDSMLLAWSDPTCGFDINGNLLTSSCSPASGEAVGFDGADMYLNGNVISVTNAGSIIAYNGGTNGGVKINNSGHVSVGNGSMKQLYMYLVDYDQDGYIPSLGSGILTNSASSWANHTRLKDVAGKGTTVGNYQIPASTSYDCDDYNNNTYPGQTAWFTGAIVDSGGTSNRSGTFDYNCDGHDSAGYGGGGNQYAQYQSLYGNTTAGSVKSGCLYSGPQCNQNNVTNSNFGWAGQWPNQSSIAACGQSQQYVLPSASCSSYIGNQTGCNSVGVTTLTQGCN